MLRTHSNTDPRAPLDVQPFQGGGHAHYSVLRVADAQVGEVSHWDSSRLPGKGDVRHLPNEKAQ